MKFEFYGATRSVTGSMHVIEANGFRLLLECGLFQGRRDEANQINRRLPFAASKIDAVILSHAHIDHSGNLPSLARSGFRGKIFLTPPTGDLCAVMLLDSAKIQQGDAQYLNKKFPDRKQVEPLYSVEDVEETVRSFRSVPYHKWIDIGPGFRAQFLDAGHILGSGIVQIEVKEGDKTSQIVFTGDLGRRGMPILKDPEGLPPCDFVISECTYGDRVHSKQLNLEDELVRVIQGCCSGKGRLIIPAFSVGRTQSIIYTLARAMRSGKLPVVPIFVDSPLSTRTTQILAKYPDVYDSEMRQTIAQQGSPLFFKGIRYVESVEESKSLNNIPNPVIIISASGMCESGRVLHHLKNAIGNPNNAVLLVGFQAVHTLGRRLKDGEKRVRILGEEHEVKAKILNFDGFSAHADRDDLLAALQPLAPRLQAAFLVHGEEDTALSFAELLKKDGFRRVEVPSRASSYTF